MPYNSYNKHWTEYRAMRQQRMPKRNLYKSVYESITGTTISFDYDEPVSKLNNHGVVSNYTDTEQAQYRWDVAKTKAMIAFLENKNKYYSKLLSFPIAVSNMSTTDFYVNTNTESDSHYGFSPIREHRYHKSWSERYQSAIDSWAVWEKEKADYNREKSEHKEKVKKEYEYMTSGKGHNYYLNELAIEHSLDIHEQVFGERLHYREIQKQNTARIAKQRQAIVEDIRDLKNGVQNVYNNMGSNCSEAPYYKGDATKIISSMRKTNKLIKDLEKDLEDLNKAFVFEWGKNTVLKNFDNDIGEINKDNPYLEKRILWESLLEPTRKTHEEICAKIESLKQHLEDLGTEADLRDQQDQKDKLFRQKCEKRKTLERNKEDRSYIGRDREEFRKARHKELTIKATGYGHGHLRSDGEEKKWHPTKEKAYKLLNKLYMKDERMLEVYKKEIDIKYVQWCKSSRKSVYKYITFDGWFLRSFQE